MDASRHGSRNGKWDIGERGKGSRAADRDDESEKDFSSLRWQTRELPVVRRDGWTIRAAIYQIERENPAMDPSRGFRRSQKGEKKKDEEMRKRVGGKTWKSRCPTVDERWNDYL